MQRDLKIKNTKLHLLSTKWLSIVCFSLASIAAIPAYAQLGGGGGTGLGSLKSSFDPNRPKEYELAGVTVTGTQYLDQDLLIGVSNLVIGQTIKLPNDENIARAIKALWKQELFSNVEITSTKIIDDKIFININVEERPRLSKFNFKNVRPNEAKELKNKVSLVANKVVTEATKKEAIERLKKHYVEKGHGRVQVTAIEKRDSTSVNKVMVTFYINKGPKTHINEVIFTGVENASEAKLKRTLKSTKEMSRLTLHPDKTQSVYGGTTRSFSKYVKSAGFLSMSKTLEAIEPYFRFKFFASSKFNETKFDEDKQALIAHYNTLGYRDATVEADTVYPSPNGNINVELKIKEGHRYYFGDIKWKGNTKYSSDMLSKILAIRKGDIYNQQLLDTRLGRQLNPDGGQDISSLYMDDGYLFFNIDPVETSVTGDTINYEMRITEGAQATIREINIAGNDRTNEHVIRRELHTLPGSKFSRSELIRSQREIANLGFFDQEKIGIQPKPHPEDGTVDIDYTVVEKSSDQLQLSAGFGGGVNFYGNVGITFNNFSAKNIFRPKLWDPLPVGDGQKFSITYASNGQFFNSLSTSFTEPWLGGKRPNSLTANIIYTRTSGAFGTNLSPSATFLRIAGGGLSMGKRLTWPDNFFIMNYGVFFNNYRLKDYALIPNFDNGYSNDLNFRFVLSRNSLDGPLYPRNGSNISFTFQFTPPYSMFSGKDYSAETQQGKYKWIEYHKYRFLADWYTQLKGNLVLRLATKYGFMGYYNKDIGYAPFGRYQIGGDGMTMGNFLIGREIISQRGYDVYNSVGTIFNKYTAEIRYPFSLSPTATIYGLAFADAANAWNSFKEFNPTRLNRDVGVGIRVFLPMFGLLGLDYGVGIDKYNPAGDVTGFKSLAKFTFMLGMEPE